MKVINTQIPSRRNTAIPVTIVDCERPDARLLVGVHGFKANRTEDGRLLTVASALAEEGVSAIMPGFPGCDESADDFVNYTLDNCLEDIDTAISYMREHYSLNDQLGMIGYSMGGRLVSLCTGRYDIKCLGIWAGACYRGFDGQPEFLGQDLEKMKEEMKEKGYCDFYNSFDGQYIKLSAKLVENMEQYDPVSLLRKYQGAAIVVHGDQDITVVPRIGRETFENLRRARERRMVVVHEADHGFGAWNNRPDLSAQLTDATVSFFRERFCGQLRKGKVYLSGPERLKKNARQLFDQYGELCEKYGLELLRYPDALFDASGSPQDSRRLAEERLQLLKECDIIIADTADFRSYVEPYNEPAFELGMAYALGKRAYAYMPDTRVCTERYSGPKHENEQGRLVDENGISFEPGPLNLMLEYGVNAIVQGTLEDALKKAHADWYGGEKQCSLTNREN
ncbi:MAG: nucleoside 2-deoxyribosyltransferase [Erysipelotrichaceae bacterium]|nr:nucleoside 2-deoxyribosyltransferase [Erysipelotrichaceae bacterium]